LTDHAAPAARRRGIPLTTQIFIGLLMGGLLGWLKPAWGLNVFFLRDIFLNLIKCIIAPLVFSSIVVGIASEADLKKVGRMGVKALLYFEIVTTLALFIGLLVVNVVRPGAGVVLNGNANELGGIAANHPKSLIETIVHIFPSSVVKAAVDGDVLQIVAFAVLFGIAVALLGPKGRPMLTFCESLSQVMFRFTDLVMRFAPVGVGAAMAHTIATQGPRVLVNLGLLILSLYLALALFIVFVLGAVAFLIRLPIKPFLKAVREPFAIAFATTSSESALPKAMEAMERIGVPRRIVSFVMPTGYSFNLDGTTLYLAMASVFVAQAYETTSHVHMDIGKQILMMLTLMITSKGVAAVPRASLVILLAALGSFNLPTIGVAVILGVDEIMDMARTSVNVLGNCLATCVVARWEGEFDDRRAQVYGTAAEPKLDLEHEDPAFALAAVEKV
jgi:proton glutamate symport protein